jgi:hypothetical protein
MHLYRQRLLQQFQRRKKDTRDNQLDSFNNDNEIESFEDLEDKCIRDYEQGCYTPVLVNLNDLNLEIKTMYR